MGIVGLILIITGILLFMFGFPVEIMGVILLLPGTLVCVAAVFLKRKTAFAIAGLAIVAIGILSQLPGMILQDDHVPPEITDPPVAPSVPPGVSTTTTSPQTSTTR